MKYKVVLLLSVVSTFLPGCDNSQSTENKQQAQELVKHSLDNMVLVKGGEFLMEYWEKESSAWQRWW